MLNIPRISVPHSNSLSRLYHFGPVSGWNDGIVDHFNNHDQYIHFTIEIEKFENND